MIELRAEAAAAGQRLDSWLADHFSHVPRAVVRQALRAGEVTLQGRRCAKGDRVIGEAIYTLAREPVAAQVEANPDLPLTILTEDAALIALNKPAGMDCQPNSPEERETLANALLAHAPEVAGVGDGPLTCGILHRIDHDTSGLVLAARTQDVYEELRRQFSAHTVTKLYRALVAGRIEHGARLENLLAHNPRCPGRMIDAERWRDAKRPMRAVTEYRPVQLIHAATRDYTLLEVTIRTGVTHQIRAQLSLAGLPIVGDRRYGGELIPGFERHFLHATAATFRHPITGQEKTLKAPLTGDLEGLLTTLRGR